MPRRWFSAALRAAALAMALLVGCGHPEESGDGFNESGAADGFTFLGIGHDTRLSDELRATLVNRLGSEAVEPSALVDLTVKHPAFLSTHLPELDLLNQALNSPPGSRVEHNVTRLTYRYARRRDLPFAFVELLFDNASARPLLMRIKATAEGAYLLETLEARHGRPKRLPAGDGADAPGLWRREGEVLLFVPVRDRQGRSEYHILIYFSANLQALATAEANARQSRQQSLQRRAGSAF
jgi:hypothetical protein